jgi:hypothetical protein
MLRRLSLVAALLISTAVMSSAWAQKSAQNQIGPHSAKEEDACQGDAHRFCRDAIPDQFRVLQCLQLNRVKLTKACQGVLQSHGM